MKRRTVLTLGTAFALSPLAAFAGSKTLEYKNDGDVQKLLDAGHTVFVDFYTTWCGTCNSQKRTIASLRDENPDYDANITFIKVDWDQFSQSDVAVMYNIPRRSTLLMLRGERELGRIVAGTARSEIKALMDKGLVSA